MKSQRGKISAIPALIFGALEAFKGVSTPLPSPHRSYPVAVYDRFSSYVSLLNEFIMVIYTVLCFNDYHHRHHYPSLLNDIFRARRFANGPHHRMKWLPTAHSNPSNPSFLIQIVVWKSISGLSGPSITSSPKRVSYFSVLFLTCLCTTFKLALPTLYCLFCCY